MTKNEKTIGILDLTRALSMKRLDIIAQIEKGRIHAEKHGNKYIFSVSEAERLTSLQAAHIGCLALAKSLSYDNSNVNVSHKRCRDDFYDFLKLNAFFDCDIIQAEDVFFADVKDELYYIKCAEVDRIMPDIKLWIDSYGADISKKLELLLLRLKDKYSGTAAILEKFCKTDTRVNSSAMLNLADYLYGNLVKELRSMNSDEIDSLADDISCNLPMESIELFSHMIAFARERRFIRNGWAYDFKHRETNRNNEAYNIDEFMLQAYTVFNKEAWISEHLVEKAIECSKYADMWLFVAMHFICGWRRSDIERLPKPVNVSKDSFTAEDIYNDADFSDIVAALEYRLMYMPMTPKKTISISNIPYLKLFIPSSLVAPFGIIMMISLSHHGEVDVGEPFISSSWEYSDFKSFFGTKFMTACGNKRFSTRRANKAYLQGIEAVSSDSENRHIGYMLAAVARSHKGGYGALPGATDIYLRDAAFSGHDPQFIAKEMFERGVFSFIPVVLLRMCSRDFSKLPVTSQTKAIEEVGLSSYAIESISSFFAKGIERAKRTVSKLLTDPEHIQEHSYRMLENIAERKAPAKQSDILCLMTAAGFDCPYTFRNGCMGCGYEIYTTGVISILMNEYKRLSALKKTAVAGDVDRYDKIITKAVLPAVAEMLSAAVSLYPDQDISFLKTIVKRGLNDA